MASDGQNEQGTRKTREGVVVSRSGDKTIVVLVERRVHHPLYRKIIRKRKKFHAHDEANEAKVGDRVSIVESRPLSRTKRWRMTGVLSKAV